MSIIAGASRPRTWLVPDWPAPANVRAFVTTREGGVSTGEYASMNLGMSSGDDRAKVEENRRILQAHLPEMPEWLHQVHGADVVEAGGERRKADGMVTGAQGRVCGVLTADCMPLFLCDEQGTRVGIAHAGWRGLAAGVVENAVGALRVAPSSVLAWMGPAIGPRAFEVGPEVRAAFVERDPDAAQAFAPRGGEKYLADLYLLARQRLARAGVTRITGGGFCTWHEPERFFSYRRAKASGRMGAFIWMQ